MRASCIIKLHMLIVYASGFLSFSSRYYFNFTINSAVVNNHITTSESLWNFSYAPYDVVCPDYELVREANDVSRKDICTEDD